MRTVSNPRKRRRTENVPTKTLDEKRCDSRNNMVGDDESIIAASTVPQEHTQMPQFTSAIVEHVPPHQHALYWSSKISSVAAGLVGGLSTLSPLWTSNRVGDPCSEQIETSVSSSEGAYSSEE